MKKTANLKCRLYWNNILKTKGGRSVGTLFDLRLQEVHNN